MHLDSLPIPAPLARFRGDNTFGSTIAYSRHNIVLGYAKLADEQGLDPRRAHLAPYIAKLFLPRSRRTCSSTHM